MTLASPEPESNSTCIYCLETKPLTAFNKEHVVHASMSPGFQRNLTLLTQVCRDCNTYFGRFHDTQLARETVHGIDRIQHGLSPTSKLDGFRGRQVQLETESENSDLGGVPAQPIDADGQLAFAMRAHVVLEMADGSSRHYFLEELQDVDLKPVTGKVKVFAATEETELELWNEAKKIFAERGRNLEVAGQYIPGTIPVFADVEFVERDFQTFSKIAFNYLAEVTKDFPGFALNNCFDQTRKYIRYGDRPDYRVVQPIGNVGYIGTFGQVEELYGHFVDLRLIRQDIHYQVIGRVTLFNRFGWQVMLCPDYRGIHFDLDRMHYWNFATKCCEPFGAGSAATLDN